MPDVPDLVMELNDFANHCGYFFNAYMQDNITANNGYNCSHPDQDEIVEDEESGKAAGCCYCWSCPLGYPPDGKDLVNYGILSEEDARAEYFDECSGEYMTAKDYIVVSDADTIRRLREAGITGLAATSD